MVAVVPIARFHCPKPPYLYDMTAIGQSRLGYFVAAYS